MKTYILLLLILLAFIQQCASTQLQSQLDSNIQSSAKLFAENVKQWCWTKNEDRRQITIDEGGQNWGWCQDQEDGDDKKNGQKKKITYNVIVNTANADGRTYTNPIMVILSGLKGKTEWIELTNDGFPKGSRVEKKIKANNVGDLNSVRLKVVGTLPFLCKTIAVEYEYKFWVFECDAELQCPKQCDKEFPLKGTQSYEMQINTSQDYNSGDSNPIYIQFMGYEKSSGVILLSENGFELGSTVNVVRKTIDVGMIKSIRLSSNKVEQWKPYKIIITRSGQNEQIFEGKGQKLSCPANCAITLDPSSLQSSAAADPAAEQTDPAAQDAKVDEDKMAQLMNGYAGEALNAQEKAKMLQLNCESQVLGKTEFGQSFATNLTNFMTVIAKCPMNCWTDKAPGVVYGVGIHPQESSICKAAVVDRAIPPGGGVIQINILTGHNQYDEGLKPEDYFTIKPESFGQSMKSFTLTKIDNIDLCESDLRIVDYNNEISSEGRVEFRNGGLWGSTCANGMNSYAARVICRMLNYNDGRLVNTESKNKICRKHKGSDYCGPNPQPIYYTDIECTDKDTHIMQCSKKINQLCEHDQDAIVSCSMQNFDVSIAPEEGTIRLAKYSAQIKAGRLEYFAEGKWGTVCNKGFGTKEAIIACQQMGFNGGDVPDGKSLKGGVNACQSYNNEDYCGEASQTIARKISRCTGGESTVKECTISKETTDCQHNFDAVIKCQGEGDPTGSSQQKKVSKGGASPLGKLGLQPYAKLECSTGVQGNSEFIGDPGSIYLVNCPPGCAEQAGVLIGTGIYRSDSSICQAGIHSGVINNQVGGYMILSIAHGIPTYIGFTQRNLESFDAHDGSQSFTVTKPASIHFLMLKLYGQNNKFVNLNPDFVANLLGQNKRFRFKEQQDKKSQQLTELINNPLNYHKRQQYHQNNSYINQDLSFLQTQTKAYVPWTGPLPIFFSSAGYVFNISPPNSDLDLKQLLSQIKADRNKVKGDLKKLPWITNNNFVIAVNFNIKKFDLKDQTILGINCWGLKVHKDSVLKFENRETEYVWNTNYAVPIMERIILMIKGEKQGTSTKFELWINGLKQASDTLQLNMVCYGPDFQLDIGILSKSFTEGFNGEIQNIKIFDKTLNDDQMKQLYQLQFDSVDMMSPEQQERDGYDVLMTADGRYCLDACTSQPHPGQPGAPEPPFGLAPQQDLSPKVANNTDPNASKAVSGQQEAQKAAKKSAAETSGAVKDGMFSWEIDAEFPGKFKDGDTTENGQESDESLDIVDKKFTSEVACSFTGAGLVGISGKKFKFDCPAKCGDEPGNVIGTGQYLDESSICKAAIHDGVIDNDNGGVFIVTIMNGMEQYEGSLANGIQSLDFHIAPRSIGFSKDNSQYQTLTCDDLGTTQAIQITPLNSKVVVKCPKGCATSAALVFGTEYYGEDSGVCKAGIHAGLLDNNGGFIDVMTGGLVNGLKGSAQQGIISLDQAEAIRSFYFVGKKNSNMNFFGPDFDSELFKNWKPQDEGSVQGSNWLFTENPIDPKETVIHQNSMIYSSNEWSYGTQLVNMQYDGSQFIYTAMVFFSELKGKAALIFFRSSEDTYYAVEFNAKNQQDFRLVSVDKGSQTVIEAINPIKVAFKVNTWFLIKIYYTDKNFIKVDYRRSMSSPIQQIFNTQIKEPKRGSVALATDNTNKVYFNMISTQPYKEEQEKNDLIDYLPAFDKCLADVKPNQILAQCNKHFEGFNAENRSFYVEGCQKKWAYCQMCCQSTLEPGQKLWMYQCTKKCVTAVKEAQRIINAALPEMTAEAYKNSIQSIQ